MKFYAVANGRTTGIFDNWEECETSVKGFNGAKFRKSNNWDDANSFLIKLSEKSKTKSIKLEIIESVMSQYFYNGMSESEACEFIEKAWDELSEQLEGIESEEER